MTEPFVVEGDLWLYCQEGGFADDAFVLRDSEPDDLYERLANVVSNSHIGSRGLDDLVAEHFGTVRQKGVGNRHIGNVRITIERLEPAQ